jgi:serine protease Do
MPQPEKKQKKAGKVFKRIFATILAIVVIAGSCTVSSFLTARYLNNQHDALLQQYVDQKFQAALDALQNPSSGGSTNVIVTVDGLSASEIYERNIQSVVAVNCTISGGAGQTTPKSSAGSGFIISEDGFIVTNYHVVEGATSVTVILANGKKYSCQVRGYDATNDVAVLKAEATNLMPVTIGRSSETKVGDPVVAIGNALGTLSFSLTVGNISGVDRKITTDGSILNMLQTDAAINSGNSGGPLFNAKGEVIGITTAKYSGTTSSGASIEGISFAIPMDDVASLISDLKEHGYVTGAYLGVTVSDVDPAAQAYGVPAGAYVHEVVEGFCAKRAGIQPGDIIIELGGYEVTSLNSLTKALRNFKGGDLSTVRVWRGGKVVVLSITFDEKPQP